MSRFSRRIRLTAVLSSVLLLQLSLRTSGALCGTHGSRASHHPASMVMHEAGGNAAQSGRMQPMAHAAMANDDCSPSAPRCDMNGGAPPCDAPWSGGGCSTMASCAGTICALTPSRVAVTQPVILADAPALSRASAPAGPSIAPELPPPRA